MNLQGIPADSQEILSEGQAEAIRSIARGEGEKSLAVYAARAAEFEARAQSGASPNEYLREAARNYRLASLTARYVGNFEKSILYAERMLALSEKLGNASLKVLALSSLYTAYQSTQNVTKAAEYLDRGFKVLPELETDSLEQIWWQGTLFKHKGDYLRSQRKLESAVESYRQGIESMEEYLTRYRTTNRWNKKRVEVAQTLRVNAYIGIGGAYYRLHKLDLALASYQRGLEISKEWALESPQSNLYRGIGEVLYDRGEFAEALISFHKALELARREQRPEMIWNAARWIAQTSRTIGKTTEAVAYYQEAIEQSESVRSLLAHQGSRASYFAARLGTYEGMVGALASTGAYGRAFDYSERARSRGFLDLLGSKVRLARQTNNMNEERLASSRPIIAAELSRGTVTEADRAYQALIGKIRDRDPEQASLMSVEPLTFSQVQELLDPGQILLEYFVTSAYERVFLWAVDKRQVHGFSIGLSRSELVKRLKALRLAISQRKPLIAYQSLARNLYAQLVAPAESFIQGKELIIVPHDVLHNLPFHALVGADGRYLIEKYPIEYLSSASLMKFTQAKRRALGEKVLAFGNPAIGDSVKELKFAEQETAAVKKLFPSTNLLLRNEATKLKVKELAQQYDILHFAAHTELKQDDPLSSAVLLAKSSTDDGRLEVRDIFGLDLKASLVVLSGCETALGKLSSGDELVGLTRAFIYAGTPSVVASLWKVDDASTAALMASFYKNLKTKSKVESLRQAQLDMIHGKVSAQLLAQRGVGGIGRLGETPAPSDSSHDSTAIATSHPYFWAPFILVGDGN